MVSASSNSSSTPGVTSQSELQHLPSPPVIPTQRSMFQHLWFVIDNYVRFIFSKSLVIFLTVHSFYALWESVLFAIYEYPELQHLLEQAQMTQEQVNFVLADATITLATSIIGAILAIRLNSIQERITHTIDMVITILLIVFHSSIRKYLLSLDFISRLQELL
jgi:hypothetical protein